MKDGEAYMQWYMYEVLATTMGKERANELEKSHNF